MINFIEKIIKKLKPKQKDIVIDQNNKGSITIKAAILHNILDYILFDYPVFEDAEIEFDEVDKEKKLYRLFIISKNSIKSMSENKLRVLKKKIMSAFKENGFNLINVIITSEENLEE
jgi:hypothetical protein